MAIPDQKREFAKEVVVRLRAAGHTALWAGGCVRDLLMQRQPKDYDVATSATPDEVRRLFGRRRTLAVGASFGVIVVLGPRGAGQVEVATFRTEGPYHNGRHPDHVQFSTPEEDARRRDFTVNGMFYDPVQQTVHDYVGGRQDLQLRLLRAIGDPAERMQEDKLRMLRAVRFAATLDFQLDSATAQTIRTLRHEIHRVSQERIAEELRKMLVDPHRQRAVSLADQLGLLAEVLPELKPWFAVPEPEAVETSAFKDVEWRRTLAILSQLEDPTFELAMAGLLSPVADQIDVRALCRRLRLSNQETSHIEWLLNHRHSLDRAVQLSQAELKRLLAHPLRDDLLELTRVTALATDENLANFEFCHEFLRQTTPQELNPTPLITGRDLIAHGLTPGPAFQRILNSVRDAQLNGEVRTRTEALDLVAHLQADTQGGKTSDTEPPSEVSR